MYLHLQIFHKPRTNIQDDYASSRKLGSNNGDNHCFCFVWKVTIVQLVWDRGPLSLQA